MRTLLIALILFTTSTNVLAKNKTTLPYYASIKSDEANVRTGPSVRYPIQWVYKKPNWPVQVTARFESWRKINDINGEIGWIHESLLTGRKYVIMQSEGVQEVYQLPLTSAAVVMILEKSVIAKLLECKNNWCKISTSGEDGWIEAKHLWGVPENYLIDSK